MSSARLPRTFDEDLAFLNQHVPVVVLENDEGAQVAVVPAWQGRTMTSTTGQPPGRSYGWIHYDLIASGQRDPVVNLFGGEDRFWISPEGSPYSFFFEPGDPMTFQHWRAPHIIDLQAFEVTDQSPQSVTTEQTGRMRNARGTEFSVHFHRRVHLLGRDEASRKLSHELDPELRLVAHESHNRLTNVGTDPWNAESGLPAIWVLGMNKPSLAATMILPFRSDQEGETSTIVNARYFGILDERRLKVDGNRKVVYFSGDGQYRSKIGLPHRFAKSCLAAWDDAQSTLTLVQYNLPDSAPAGYTNNLWDPQQPPYAGDCINAYNDGPNESGGMLGPFYELETLSPALPLDPGEAYTHVHRTFHFEGPEHALDALCQATLGITLKEIRQAF